MLKACPEVHSNRSDLYLYLDFLFRICQKDGNGYDQMQASVSVWLWIFYVILSSNQCYVILLQKCLGNAVNIVNVRAYHTDSRNIVDILFYAVNREWEIVFHQLFQNTLGSLESGVDRTDGIALVL